jgi:hypothetical protein
MVQHPLKIQEKSSKKIFFGYLPGTKSTFLGPNNFSNFFWLHLVPGTTIEKKNIMVNFTVQKRENAKIDFRVSKILS